MRYDYIIIKDAEPSTASVYPTVQMALTAMVPWYKRLWRRFCG
jgi:hypothetical protein